MAQEPQVKNVPDSHSKTAILGTSEAAQGGQKYVGVLVAGAGFEPAAFRL